MATPGEAGPLDLFSARIQLHSGEIGTEQYDSLRKHIEHGSPYGLDQLWAERAQLYSVAEQFLGGRVVERSTTVNFVEKIQTHDGRGMTRTAAREVSAVKLGARSSRPRSKSEHLLLGSRPLEQQTVEEVLALDYSDAKERPRPHIYEQRLKANRAGVQRAAGTSAPVDLDRSTFIKFGLTESIVDQAHQANQVEALQNIIETARQITNIDQARLVLPRVPHYGDHRYMDEDH